MFKTVWRFEVKPDAQSKFELIYGPEGDWAKLFRRAEGYISTELFRNIESFGYVTIDTWHSLEDFEKFKIQWKAEYNALDQRCEGFTLSESRIC